MCDSNNFNFVFQFRNITCKTVTRQFDDLLLLRTATVTFSLLCLSETPRYIAQRLASHSAAWTEQVHRQNFSLSPITDATHSFQCPQNNCLLLPRTGYTSSGASDSIYFIDASALHRLVFNARASARAVLGVIILSVCLSHALIVTKLNDTLQIFLYHTKGQSLCYSETKSGWWATPPSL